MGLYLCTFARFKGVFGSRAEEAEVCHVRNSPSSFFSEALVRFDRRSPGALQVQNLRDFPPSLGT
jgi:hypothetical protein